MTGSTVSPENIAPFRWAKKLQRDFFSGGLAGAVGIFIGYPLDLVKLRLQNEPQLRSLSARKCFQKILRDEGLNGLYRGCLPPIFSQGFINALLFFGESFTSRILEPAQLHGYLSLTVTQCIAGSFGGLLSCSVLVPAEVIKVSMQAKKPSTSIHSSSSFWIDTIDEVKTLYRAEGTSGFFKGFSITALRQMPANAIYFYSYRKFRSLFASSTDYIRNDIAIAVSGGLAGCTGWIVTYPLDVIKTNIQLSSLEPPLPPRLPTTTSSSCTPSKLNTTGSIHNYHAHPRSGSRKSVFQVAATLHRMHGFSVFYRGIGVCIARAFPVNCVIFYVYEYLSGNSRAS